MESMNRPPEEKMNQQPSPEGGGYESYARPSRRGRYTVIAVIVMLLIAAIFARSQWLRIRDVEVFGLIDMTPAQVLDLAGIDAGSTYFNLNEKKISQRINANRYLEFVSMEKLWPNGLILTVNERRKTANFLYVGVQYILAEDGMVLESTNNIALDNGCIKVTGLNVHDIRVGARVVCQSQTQLETMQNVLAELKMQGVLGDMAELNLSSLESIYLVTMDGYTANIGDSEELRAKIGTVRAVAEELRRRGLMGGIIEATVPGQASYRPAK